MSDLERDPYDVAAERGLDVVLPGEDEIQLDIDNPESEVWLGAMLAVLHTNGKHFAETARTTSAGGNTHVTLSTEIALEPIMRIALQACLGSDRKRELLSLLRVLRGSATPTLFFEAKRPAGELPTRGLAIQEPIA